MGQSYAITVWRWLQTLEWPPVDGNNPPNPLDWGISFLELVRSLQIITGIFLPVATNPGERYVNYVDYFSDEAYLLPPKARAANAQVYMLEKLLRQLVTLTKVEVIPTFQRHKRWPCCSLAKLGFHPPAGGIPRRPKMQKAQDNRSCLKIRQLESCIETVIICTQYTTCAFVRIITQISLTLQQRPVKNGHNDASDGSLTILFSSLTTFILS